MNQEQRTTFVAKWDKRRQKGRPRFVLIFGVLLWGVPTAILVSLLNAAMGQTDPTLFAVNFIGFPIGGIAFGRFMWSLNETVYKQAVSRFSQPLAANRAESYPKSTVTKEFSSKNHSTKIKRETLDTSMPSTPPIRVFLCHASEDKPAVRTLYGQLKSQSINPWFDEQDLLPGQDWQLEIQKAVRESHAVIVCLSRSSVDKEGFVQKEIKQILDIADEKPQGTIFIIPLLLEKCKIPEPLSRLQWVNSQDEEGFDKLVRALRTRAKDLKCT